MLLLSVTTSTPSLVSIIHDYIGSLRRCKLKIPQKKQSNETIRRDFGLFFAKNTLATTDMMYLDTSRYNSVNSTVTSYNTSAEIVESLLGDAFDQIFAE